MAANPEQVKISSRADYRTHKEKRITSNRAWRAVNRERSQEYHRNYRAAHSAQKRAWSRARWSDPCYRMSVSLRNRLNSALRGQARHGSAVRDLGCSLSELRSHLEALFQPGMNWENWSMTGWHIDHIKPLAKFDLTDRTQLLEACHYTNLQPLWAKDNFAKGDRMAA